MQKPYYERLELSVLILFILSPIFTSILNSNTIEYYEIQAQTIYFYCHVITPLIGMLTILLLFFRVKNRQPPFYSSCNAYIFFLTLCVYCLISTTITGWSNYALVGDLYRNESVFTQLSYFIVFFFVSSQVKSLYFRRILIDAIIAVSVLIIPYSFWLWGHIVNSISLSTSWDPGLIGVFFNINHYGYYLVISTLLSSGMIISENGGKRWLYIFAFIANTVTLSFNNTFGAWLAISLALLVQILLYRFKDQSRIKWAVISFLLFIFTTAITGFWTKNVFHSIIRLIQDILLITSNSPNAGKAGSSRWEIWAGTISMIKQKPLFGWGMEGIMRFDKVKFVGNDRPHNEYLQYAVFYGIPVAILYIAGCVSVMVNGIGSKRKDMLHYAIWIASVGYMISAFFGNTMFYTTPYFFICLGLTLGSSKE